MIACWILFNLSSPACLHFLCECVWSAPPYSGSFPPSPDLCWRNFPPNPRNTCLDLRIITGESEKYTVMLEQLKPFIALTFSLNLLFTVLDLENTYCYVHKTLHNCKVNKSQ
ncbi:hypothetical protein GOODEAATRI_004415 [Goodea atripinnis]|uniref:Secreted protein n=1 Tax=Goodea atripinnis TaxID=208336 RepID=A0ABV0NRT6_9TELE